MLGNSTFIVFDAAGRRVAETNQDHIVTLYGHDGAGRLVAVTNALGTAQQAVTRYAYDEAGNQTAQIDALNRTNRFEYDPSGRRTKRTLPGGQSESFGYDLLGNLIRHTNFNNVVITNAYDAMNRLLVKATALGVGLLTNFYSASGMLTQRVDAAGLHTWIYDARDRLRTHTTPVGTLLYTWDANGNPTGLKSTTPDGVDLTYEYDALNRLTNVVDNRLTGAKNTAYTFDAVGNLATLKYPNGVTNRWQYDALNRLTNLSWKLNGNARADFAYKLGAGGQRTNLSETVNSISRVFAWQFDRLYRLTNEVVTGASPTGNLGYGYDAVGNRLNRSGTLGTLGGQTLAYSVNDWIDDDANPNNGSTYFDGNGNTTSLDGTWQYDWANRLTNYNNGTATYTYDGDGNRIKKTAGGVTTWYLVATVNPSGWPQVVEEHTGSSPGALSRRYTYGLDLISQSRWTGSAWETHFYLTDGLGSTRALLNSSGNISDTYTYDAWGNLIASTGTTPNAYLFAGEQWDAAIGQYYLRARTMHPGYGRFWTRDTFEGVQTDPLSLHKYLYGADDPVNNVDPSGHFTTTEILVTTRINVGLTLLVNGVILYAAYSADQVLAEAREKRVIEQFVATHEGAGITQEDFNKLEVQARWPKSKKPLYLHYGRTENAGSLLLGLWSPSWATRTVYLTGWQAKYSLALKHIDPPNAVYIVRPKRGFEPIGPNIVAGDFDRLNRWMPGGGQEWKFNNGSGGVGTVFGPIPVPEGTQPGNN